MLALCVLCVCVCVQGFGRPLRAPRPTVHALPARGSAGPSGEAEGVRLNKCLSELSRRAADAAIEQGRVTVNGRAAACGARVRAGDKVRLDGQLQRWEGAALARQEAASPVLEQRRFVYLKYWKPVGVTSTSDPTDPTNIIRAGGFDLFPQRLFTVGRLDKDSSGLILLTSDGRVNNALLSPGRKREKSYEVTMNRCPTAEQVARLAAGVEITTTAQRDGRARELTRPTLPCKVARIEGADRGLRFTLTEGRNRQIRRMAEAVGLAVAALHRTSFAGISLRGLSSGNWAELSEREMLVVVQAVEAARDGDRAEDEID